MIMIFVAVLELLCAGVAVALTMADHTSAFQVCVCLCLLSIAASLIAVAETLRKR